VPVLIILHRFFEHEYGLLTAFELLFELVGAGLFGGVGLVCVVSAVLSSGLLFHLLSLPPFFFLFFGGWFWDGWFFDNMLFEVDARIFI